MTLSYKLFKDMPLDIWLSYLLYIYGGPCPQEKNLAFPHSDGSMEK